MMLRRFVRGYVVWRAFVVLCELESHRSLWRMKTDAIEKMGASGEMFLRSSLLVQWLRLRLRLQLLSLPAAAVSLICRYVWSRLDDCRH